MERENNEREREGEKERERTRRERERERTRKERGRGKRERASGGREKKETSVRHPSAIKKNRNFAPAHFESIFTPTVVKRTHFRVATSVH